MAPAAQSNHATHHDSCSGLLIVNGNSGRGTCLGLRTAFKESVDLAAWHAAQRPDIEPGDLMAATCLGRSVFDAASRGAARADAPPPPICIGVEWLRINHAAMRQQQGQQGQQGQRQVLMQQRDPGTQHQQQQQPAAPMQRGGGAPSAAPSPSAAPAAPAAADGWLDAAAARARAASAVTQAAVEAYFGDRDPLWFAKRFADRARANADAMGRMAGQIAAAAMGRLPPEEAEDDA